MQTFFHYLFSIHVNFLKNIYYSIVDTYFNFKLIVFLYYLQEVKSDMYKQTLKSNIVENYSYYCLKWKLMCHYLKYILAIYTILSTTYLYSHDLYCCYIERNEKH